MSQSKILASIYGYVKIAPEIVESTKRTEAETLLKLEFKLFISTLRKRFQPKFDETRNWVERKGNHCPYTGQVSRN